MAFLTCFGAVGYLLTRLSPWALPRGRARRADWRRRRRRHRGRFLGLVLMVSADGQTTNLVGRSPV